MGKFTTERFLSLIADPACEQLDCSFCEIDDTQAAEIAKGLQRNFTLRVLYLRGNTIGDDGIKALVQGLTTNHTLEFIHLGGNDFGERGMLALADLRRMRSSLRIIDVDPSNLHAAKVRQGSVTQQFCRR